VFINLRTVQQEATWRLCGTMNSDCTARGYVEVVWHHEPSDYTARGYLEVVWYHEPSNYINNVSMGGCVIS
jgi:hypothetical protein